MAGWSATGSGGRILVTGFGPFGDERVNPSGLIARRLGGIELPVAADEAWERTREELQTRGCSGVLALGVAGGRDRVCVEARAANASDYRLPDDFGRRCGGVIDGSVPTLGLSSRVPASMMARRMRGVGVPARVSRDAGRYVCNHFYFLLLRRLAGRAVFVHVPRLPEEAARLGGGPSLSLDQAERAVSAGLRLMDRWLTELACR